MEFMQRLTLPTVYCVILYALNNTADDPLNSVLSALHHSLTLFQSLRKLIWKGPGNCLVYHTLALPKRHKLGFLRSLLASLFNTLTRSWLVKLKTLW